MLVFCLIKQLQTESPYVYRLQRSCRKVMFSVVSVCLFTGVSCGRYPWYIGHHYTGTPSLWTWNLTVQGPLDMGSHCTAPCGSDIWWPRLEIYSNVFTAIRNNANVFSVMSIDFVHMSIYILNDEGRKRYYFPRDFKKYSFTTKQFRKKQINSGGSWCLWVFVVNSFRKWPLMFALYFLVQCNKRNLKLTWTI